MKRNSKYVGLDVHQAMTAVTVRGEGGRVIMRSVIETTERSITEFFSALGPASVDTLIARTGIDI